LILSIRSPLSATNLEVGFMGMKPRWPGVAGNAGLLEFAVRSLNGTKSRAMLALVVAAAAAAPAVSQRAGAVDALAKLQQGLWQFRVLGGGASRLPPVCIGDPAVLAQLQHRNTPCSRLVVAEDGEGATVHYTCPAGGYGQTSLRIETPRLVQIDTQGISDNTPFSFRAEARLVGSCNAGQRSSGR
jgi:hypothetical protein